MGQLLAINNVSYQDFLHYSNVHIEEHVVTFISGDSGSGKSTLLKFLNGSLTPTKGQVFYHEIDIMELDMIDIRREILLVKQVPYLFQGSVLQNFEQFHAFHETICPTKEQIEEYLTLCCISTPLDALCDTMSGGERQRIFLSIALSMNPKVLLLDEPTSALHKELAIDVLQNIITYAKCHQISLIMISHDKELQGMFAENVIELRRSL